MSTMTRVHAYGGGYMLRGAGGRFVGVARCVAPAGPGALTRWREGREYTVTVLPDGKVPRWCKARAIGKSQHGKRRGVRHGEREQHAFRAYMLSV